MTHRWLSLVLGVLLLAETTSGAILLYSPEIVRATHRAAYTPHPGAWRISDAQALRLTRKRHPDMVFATIGHDHGVYRLENSDYTLGINVDPVTGDELGAIDQGPSWLRFLSNLHECGLGCEGEPGYVALLNKPVPHTGVLDKDHQNSTVAMLLLDLTGSLMVYLCLTGLWLWFPRPRRWRQGFTVRWNRGRFARDTDLHKVIGVAALAPMLWWGITGAGFETTRVAQAWYAITGTDYAPYVAPASTEQKGRDIGIDAAVAAAHRFDPGARIEAVGVPVAAGDAYDIQVASRPIEAEADLDPPGTSNIVVDRYSGAAHEGYNGRHAPWAQQAWQGWQYASHTGSWGNGWWKILYLAAGLAPLLLAITGMSTWLVRRRSKRNRRHGRAGMRSRHQGMSGPRTTPLANPESPPGSAERPEG